MDIPVSEGKAEPCGDARDHDGPWRERAQIDSLSHSECDERGSNKRGTKRNGDNMFSAADKTWSS